MPPFRFARRLLLVAVAVSLALLPGCDGGGDDGVRVATIAGGLAIGDGGPATATFLYPIDVAVDARGDVFVADGNQVVDQGLVRRIDARTGIITSDGRPCGSTEVARGADGTCTRFVDALATRNGEDVLVASVDRELLRLDVRRDLLTLVAGDRDCPGIPGDTAPLGACLGRANGLAFDAAGNLYVADGFVVRRLDAAGRRLTVIGGKTEGFCHEHPDASGALLATEACLGGSRDLAVDRDGNVFLATDGELIRRIDRVTGLISTVAGEHGDCLGDRGDGGPATRACLSSASSVAVADDGTLFVADRDRIRRIDPATSVITTLLDRGTDVEHLAIAPDGSVVAAEFRGGGSVVRLDPATGAVTTIGGNGSYSACGEDGPTKDACLGRPSGLAREPDGALIVVDGENSRVLRIDPATGRTTRIAGGQSGFCGDGGPALDACFRNLTDVARDAAGNLYLADSGDEDQGGLGDVLGRVRRIDAATGTITTVAGDCPEFDRPDARTACLLHPSSLLFDGRGGLFVGGQDGVHRIDIETGTIRVVVGDHVEDGNCGAEGIAAVDACVSAADLALDEAGDLLVLDLERSRVRRVDAATGLITTVAGNGDFSHCPQDDGLPATSTCLLPLAIVPAPDGRLVIATAGVLRAVDLATGTIETVPGSPPDCMSVSPSPDGCVFPSDMELDDAGRLVVTEPSTHRVRRVTLP